VEAHTSVLAPAMRITLLFLPLLTTLAMAADWPQWRGPLRNGVLPNSPPLLEKLPEGGPRELWESEVIPSNEDGGLSSPVVSGGKVFIALVWHRQEPSETRQIDEIALRQLGFQPTSGLSADLLKKIEDTRSKLAPNLRGRKLEEFADKFSKENLDGKQQQLYAGWLKQRFTKGQHAIPLTVLDALDKHKEHVFGNETEMKKWVADQGWADWVNAQIFAAVSPTKRVAEDVVICLDAETGKTLWKTSRPGAVVGFDGSSTPCVQGDRIYALGSQRVWCLNTQDGSLVWESSLEGNRRGLGSSPLVEDGVLVVNVGKLTAFDTQAGGKLWAQEKAGGLHASPVIGSDGGRKLVLINGKNLSAVDLKSGAIVWSVPAGGDSTPTVEKDRIVTQSFDSALGLVAYRMSAEKAEKLWNFPYPSDVVRTQSSPIIFGGRVYLVDDNHSYCLDAATGKPIWSAQNQSTISSPVIADGRLFAMTNNGNTLVMMACGTEEYRELGRSTVRAQWVPSPCIVDGKLILRLKDKVKAWSLVR
jgi:outer membrane protein assembly factor BamB